MTIGELINKYGTKGISFCIRCLNSNEDTAILEMADDLEHTLDEIVENQEVN